MQLLREQRLIGVELLLQSHDFGMILAVGGFKLADVRRLGVDERLQVEDRYGTLSAGGEVLIGSGANFCKSALRACFLQSIFKPGKDFRFGVVVACGGVGRSRALAKRGDLLLRDAHLVLKFSEFLGVTLGSLAGRTRDAAALTLEINVGNGVGNVGGEAGVSGIGRTG